MFDVVLRGIPYYFVFCILFLLYRRYSGLISKPLHVFYKEKQRKQLLRYAYLILLFFFGLRGYVYTDFVNYKPFFDMLDGFRNLPEILLIKGWEPGFVVYSAFCKLLVPNYFAWNFISTLIDLFLLYKILERYSTNHLLSLMVYFVIGSTALEFNVLRNAKAIFVFLYALRYIEERKIWKYVAAIGVACLFHISSILYFPLYFILHRKWPQLVLWSIFIGGAVVLFLHIGIVSDIVAKISFAEGGRVEYLTGYLDNNAGYSSTFGTIERLCTMLIVVVAYNRIAQNTTGNYIFINMYILLFAVFTFCAESAVMVQRFQYMFIASFWIIYPLLIEYAQKYKKRLVYYFVTGLLGLKLVLIAEDPNLKYENILTGVSDFDSKVNYVERNLGK